MTNIVELWGAPGSGKSTNASKIFGYLKDSGQNAELVREVAKDFAHADIKIDDAKQYFIMGKQLHDEMTLISNVSFIVTDAPSGLQAFYAQNLTGADAMVLGYYANNLQYVNRIPIFIQRTKVYNPKGRYQTEEESDLMSDEMYNFMLKFYREDDILITDSDRCFKDVTKLLKRYVNLTKRVGL